MATDPAHDATDEEIRRLSKRLHAAYSRAYMEMAERAKADLERQAEADREMAARVEAGEMTPDQLAAWRRGRAADATWYAQMVNQLARQMAECDRQAAAIVNGASPAVYAENANYGAFQVEEAAKVDTSWTLVDADTVAGLVRDHPDLLPQVSPNPSKTEAWARKKVTSAIIQSVLVGESVPAAARRIRSVVDMDERAATRAARTALTGAENAGRVSSYDRARGMGIDVRARWMATLDSRTRDSHRQLDGEVAGDDGRFSNGLRYPGDPTGPASEVWNCRCTLVASMPGYDAFEDRNESKLETSYEDWKAGRDPKRPKPSGRTLKEFMDTPAAESAARRAGVSKAQLRRRIVSQLNADGRTGRDFPSMTRAEQQEALGRAVEGRDRMAGRDIEWPRHGTMLRASDYKELRKEAESSGLALRGFRRSDADPAAVRLAVRSFRTVVDSDPKIAKAVGDGMTLELTGMASGDFAFTTLEDPRVIHVSRDAFRDAGRLSEEYRRLADDGFFVHGTTSECILYHELGHVVTINSGIDPLDVLRSVTGLADAEALIYARDNLSRYSASFSNGIEVISEAFSGYYGNSGNDLAKAIYDEVLRRLP